MQQKIDELYSQFNCETIKQKTILKQLISVLNKHNACDIDKQKYTFIDYDLFLKIYSFFEKLATFFDYSYGVKESYEKYFEYLYQSIKNKIPINIVAIFCPGYEGDGYKNKAGRTTRDKLKLMGEIKNIFTQNNIKANFNMIYADVFLENTDTEKVPDLIEQLNINKRCYIEEGSQYFNNKELIFLSEQPEFSGQENFKGYSINPSPFLPAKTINAFNKDNIRFYTSLNWDKKRVEERTNTLITLYLKVCDYIKTHFSNAIYLPMENMYLRTIIFEQMDICSLYLYYDKAK